VCQSVVHVDRGHCERDLTGSLAKYTEDVLGLRLCRHRRQAHGSALRDSPPASSPISAVADRPRPVRCRHRRNWGRPLASASVSCNARSRIADSPFQPSTRRNGKPPSDASGRYSVGVVLQNAVRRCHSCADSRSTWWARADTVGGAPLRGSRSITLLSNADWKNLGRRRKLCSAAGRPPRLQRHAVPHHPLEREHDRVRLGAPKQCN
jgi:hypothetical protein